MRTWMEELFDILLFFGITIGSLFFFMWYWESSYRLRCAELVLGEFLENVSADGGFSRDEYETLVQQVKRLDAEYELEISCTGTCLEPDYAYIPKEQLDSYYLKRNIRRESTRKTETIVGQETESKAIVRMFLCRMDSEHDICMDSVQTAVLQLGETLSQAGFFLEVLYQDGYTEKVFPEEEAWSDNYDANYCGMQSVTVQYMGKSVDFMVVTEGGTCRECHAVCTGKTYEDYEKYPYCTECMSNVLLFSGEVFEVEVRNSMSEILAELEQQNYFGLEKGDILAVVIKKNENYQVILQKIMKKDKE